MPLEGEGVDDRCRRRRGNHGVECAGFLADGSPPGGGLAREEHPEPRLFGLCQTALLLLDAASAARGPASRLALEAKASTFAAPPPPLDSLAACRRPEGAYVGAHCVRSASRGRVL